MSEPSPLDVDLLDEGFDVDAEGTRELIDMYLAQADETLAGLRQAIEAGEADGVRQLAHRLAGSSAVCGVSGMIGPLRALEQQGRACELSEAGSLMTVIVERLQSCRALLVQYLAAKSGHP